MHVIHNLSPATRSYLTGLVLAIALTAFPFAIVATDVATRPIALAVIATAGLAQALVHLHYFLHLSFNADGRERSYILLFAILLIAIMAGGTMLVMSDLNARMM